MADGPHRDAVVNLEKFLARFPQRQEQDPLPVAERDDRTARGELGLDVLRAVRDRLDPTIRFFDHATLRSKTAAMRLSGRVVLLSREPNLRPGKSTAFP